MEVSKLTDKEIINMRQKAQYAFDFGTTREFAEKYLSSDERSNMKPLQIEEWVAEQCDLLDEVFEKRELAPRIK